MASPSESLRKYEVGMFADLAARPNPEGWVIVTVPPIDDLLPLLERRAGRKFTEQEMSEHRRRAASIALPKDEADRMAAAQAARRRSGPAH